MYSLGTGRLRRTVTLDVLKYVIGANSDMIEEGRTVILDVLKCLSVSAS